jgi:CheY-like chemotaxis protein
MDHVVVGDANRLKQILINIISNAIKYTNIGGHIALQLESLPAHHYRFTCTDNGIGMTKDFIRHICDDYVRAEDSRVSKTQGTGLGMSVVKAFTELMGGTLTIKSELGKGSTFIVEIPFPDASKSDREAILQASVDNKVDNNYTGKRVLLVEDNALNAEIAIELLQTIGLTVDWAENGEIGIERYEASALDEYFAVFMDMQMPVMDGITATKRIRQSSRPDHDIPIFAMTANTFASDRRNCREAGMTGYIPKPVSVQNIEEALTVIEK